jgi:subtilisin family serine protease
MGVLRRATALAAALALGVPALLATTTAAPATAQAQAAGEVERKAEPVPGQYVVTLKPVAPDTVAQVADDLARGHRGRVLRVYAHALEGFAVQMSDDDARALAADPAVESVEEDGVVHASVTQANPPSWGLDRIDQTNLPLNGSYTYTAPGTHAHAYVIDTGVRVTHPDFGGRATSGWDFVGNDANADDCHGHGTHVAGTIGGSAVGVAKDVSIVAVRVLDCTGSGTFSAVIAGIDWVTLHAIRPAVANMSLGGSPSAALDQAVQSSIASGVTYAIAAGNENQDACNVSPARVPQALTVGATDSGDVRASFSNFGPCVDMFAPGVAILSTWISGFGVALLSGTSMAAPHVAGAAARYLDSNWCATPAEVAAALTGSATTAHVGAAGAGSPNLLLATAFIGPTESPFPNVPCPPQLGAVPVSGGVHLSWKVGFDRGGGVVAYALYRGTSPGGEGASPYVWFDHPVESYDDTAVVGGTTYYYRVQAVNAVGSGPLSAEQSAAPNPPGAPGAPTLAASGQAGKVSLSWTVPPDNGSPITGYQVWRGTTPGNGVPFGSPVDPGQTAYDDTAVTPGTTYFYTVTAANAVGPSPPSNQVSAAAGIRVSLALRSSTGPMKYQACVASLCDPPLDVGTPPTGVFGDAALVSASGSLWVFLRGGDGALWYRKETGPGTFTPWASLGGLFLSNPAAVWDGTSVWVFERGFDSGLWYRKQDGPNSFGPWTTLGPAIVSDPSAVWDGASVWVFARGTDNGVWYRRQTGPSMFAAWATLGPAILSDLAVVRDATSIWVFGRGTDSGLWYRKQTSGSTFASWTSLGPAIVGDPAAIWDGSSVWAFASGTDNGLWYRKQTGPSTFAAWATLGRYIASSPAVLWDGSSIWAFARGGDNALWFRKSAGSSWGGWVSAGGSYTSNPSGAVG